MADGHEHRFVQRFLIIKVAGLYGNIFVPNYVRGTL